ncbi:protein lifeguard 1 [Halichoeres trimaculatus]|uniref:protein lifeguard 1 n=1 Tax=Halichoeres trimaculatus TaxID=147232 RepID=UPI003D9EEA04
MTPHSTLNELQDSKLSIPKIIRKVSSVRIHLEGISINERKEVKTRFALIKWQPGRFNDILRTSFEYPIESNEGYILFPPELKSCLCGNLLIAGRLCPEGEEPLQEEQQGRSSPSQPRMDHEKGISRDEENGARPPPYNAQGYGENTYTGMSYQVGKGNIAVVSPPSTYDNVAHFEPPAGGSPDYSTPPDYSDDTEDSIFSDRNIRRGFIRKVYLTLMVQLLVTVGIICAFLYWEALREWTLENPWLTYTMMPATLVLVMALACCENLRRQVPLNFIALGLFTVIEGLMLGSLAAFFDAEAVMWAVGATALVSFSLSVFAMQSKWDFTAKSGSLWVFAWTLFSFGLLCAIYRSQFLHILYACLGTLVFSVYLVFDTQLILGENKKYKISPEEYVFAALNLYLDIVTLFLLLLKLISICR